ncbi:MAG TPA: hypothetical protein VIX80_07825, partial [Candidatus Kapabacteria bacterium]
MEQQLTNNELIYLLLDGEATPTERGRLFDAMSKDHDLQDEFERALKMKNAFEHEVRDTKPAPFLTGALFTKLGLTTIGLGGGAAISTGITTAAKTGWLALTSKIIIPVAAALLGSAVTYFAVSSGESSNSISNGQTVAPQTQQNVPESPAPAPTELSAVTNTNTSQSTRTIIKTVYVPSAVIHDTVIIEKQVFIPQNTNINSNEVAVKEVATPSVTPKNENPVEALQVQNINDKEQKTLTDIRETKTNDGTDIFVGVRGMTMLTLFPSREIESSEKDLINNLSVNVRYNLTNNHSFGVEGGQETFPINVVGSDGTIEEKTSLLWGGMFYRFTTDPFVSIGGLQLFGQILGGGTVSGPMGKLTTGMVWQPDSRVELMLGVEGMMQSYRYNGNWGHGEKISMTTGVA